MVVIACKLVPGNCVNACPYVVLALARLLISVPHLHNKTGTVSVYCLCVELAEVLPDCGDGTLWHPMRGEEGCGQSVWLFKQAFQSPDNSYFCGCPVCWLARPNLAHKVA